MTGEALAGSVLRAVRERRSPLLAYHGVADVGVDEDPLYLMIPARRLLAQVHALARAGFELVTVAELVERSGGAGERPSGLAAVTFDDGLLNVYEPLLELAAEGIRASLYPVTDWLGRRHPRIADRGLGRILGEPEIRELADAGVEIGTHTASHRDLSRLPLEQCMTELQESRERLEGITGRPVRTAAYPLGRHGDAAREAVRRLGLEAALAEERGADWPYAIERAPILRRNGWGTFVLKASGAWSPVAYGFPGRAVRVLTRPARRRIRLAHDRGASRR